MEEPKEVVEYNYVQCYYVCITMAVTLPGIIKLRRCVCVPGFLKLLLSRKTVCMNECMYVCPQGQSRAFLAIGINVS